MHKQEIIKRLEESREKFLDLIEDLPESAYLQIGVVGEWSIKDLLAHLSRWEAEMVKLLWQLQTGQPPSSLHFDKQLNVDSQNAAWFQEARDRSLDKVLEDFHAVRNQTLLRLEKFTERDLTDPKRFTSLKGKPLEDYIAGDSYDHEDEHRIEIQRWLEKQSLPKQE
jgi:hypothetical protein